MKTNKKHTHRLTCGCDVSGCTCWCHHVARAAARSHVGCCSCNAPGTPRKTAGTVSLIRIQSCA